MDKLLIICSLLAIGVGSCKEKLELKPIVLPKNWTVQMINKFELLNEQKEKKIQFRV